MKGWEWFWKAVGKAWEEAGCLFRIRVRRRKKGKEVLRKFQREGGTGYDETEG